MNCFHHDWHGPDGPPAGRRRGSKASARAQATILIRHDPMGSMTTSYAPDEYSNCEERSRRLRELAAEAVANRGNRILSPYHNANDEIQPNGNGGSSRTAGLGNSSHHNLSLGSSHHNRSLGSSSHHNRSLASNSSHHTRGLTGGSYHRYGSTNNMLANSSSHHSRNNRSSRKLKQSTRHMSSDQRDVDNPNAALVEELRKDPNVPGRSLLESSRATSAFFSKDRQLSKTAHAVCATSSSIPVRPILRRSFHRQQPQEQQQQQQQQQQQKAKKSSVFQSFRRRSSQKEAQQLHPLPKLSSFNYKERASFVASKGPLIDFDPDDDSAGVEQTLNLFSDSLSLRSNSSVSSSDDDDDDSVDEFYEADDNATTNEEPAVGGYHGSQSAPREQRHKTQGDEALEVFLLQEEPSPCHDCDSLSPSSPPVAASASGTDEARNRTLWQEQEQVLKQYSRKPNSVNETTGIDDQAKLSSKPSIVPGIVADSRIEVQQAQMYQELKRSSRTLSAQHAAGMPSVSEQQAHVPARMRESISYILEEKEREALQLAVRMSVMEDSMPSLDPTERTTSDQDSDESLRFILEMSLREEEETRRAEEESLQLALRLSQQELGYDHDTHVPNDKQNESFKTAVEGSFSDLDCCNRSVASPIVKDLLDLFMEKAELNDSDLDESRSSG